MAEGIRIKLADPGVTAGDERAVIEALRSGWLSGGPRVPALEADLARRTGRAHAVAVSSGTAALHVAMEALGVGPGSTVVVPALTFPSPAVAAARLGARVRVCDVEPATMNLSARTLAPLLDAGTSLVVAIDQFGVPAPFPEIEALAADRGAPVLVDAACSLGSSLGGRPCGSFGAAAIFSFHPRKLVTTGEGGALLTDDRHLAHRARLLRNIGMGDGGFEDLGSNLRLPELGAALGRSQLARLDGMLERRRELAARYLRGLPALRFQQAPDRAEVNFQTLAAVLPEGFSEGDRDGLRAALRGRGVELGIASHCLGALPGLAARLGIDAAGTPAALEIHRRGLALPLHPGLDEAAVDEVIELVNRWMEQREVSP
jgi:perosamine synthetase